MRVVQNLSQGKIEGVDESDEAFVRDDERRRDGDDMPPGTAREEDEAFISESIDDIERES